MNTPESILKQYWGYDQFRPLQREIVEAVLDRRDVLALLPTGGGKSVCFQVPAMLMDGTCLVISPLIALMKDQVEQLTRRGVSAIAVHSGMPRKQIDVLLDNAVYGNIKFLYVSPERLQTEIFIERIKKARVCLVAVDEAHCISQWGYDFRPAYLHIAALRDLLQEVSFVALTASATAVVRKDIADKLLFRPQHAVFQGSFARNNLSFVVRKSENKEKKLLEVLSKTRGSSILYVRSRKATQEIAEWLARKGITAVAYHAGLEFAERMKRQEGWINNRHRVMVATNAFGMGIDKPDVRSVIHLDVPENLESYYQEAGRAGRDGQRAYAVLIYHDGDIVNLKAKVEQSHPALEELRKVYQAMANYLQLAVGSAEGQSFDFDLPTFAERFHFNATSAYAAVRKLEEEGLVEFNESFYQPAVVHLTMDKLQLYEFQVANERFDPLLKMMLRLYGGEILSGFARISEAQVAQGLKVTTKEVVDMLQHLNDLQVLIYQPTKDKPQVTFTLPRQDVDHLPVDRQRMEERKKLVLSKMEAMIKYSAEMRRCRMQMIQDYFDELTYSTCGICDNCIAKRRKENEDALANLREEVLRLLGREPMTVEQLEDLVAPEDSELFVDVVRELVDEGDLQYDQAWRLNIVQQKSR